MTKTPLISIVDDDDLTRAAMENLVKSLGFSARTFASAESFLESAASVAETRCLILDVQMPEMSGIDLQDHLSQRGIAIPIPSPQAKDVATRTSATTNPAIRGHP